MYVITEWFERYEVNDKGQPAKRGDKLRVRPLDYIRSKVHGRAKGAGFQAMEQLAKERTWEVFGQFQKFLEIAGSENRHKRGCLLNARGKPASNEDLAFILGTPVESVKATMQVLINEGVGWIRVVPDEILQEFQENLEADEKDQIPGIPGIPGALYNESRSRTEVEDEQNRIKLNETRAREDNTSDNSNLKNEQGVDSTLLAPSSSISTRLDSPSVRLDFWNKLRNLLCPRSNADHKALLNFQRWVEKQYDTEMAEQALGIAQDSLNGRNPMAVFFSRCDKELGYRAHVEADKRK